MPLSSYERRRLLNIQRNERVLRSLGLGGRNDKAAARPKSAPRQKKRRANGADGAATRVKRRSIRLVKKEIRDKEAREREETEGEGLGLARAADATDAAWTLPPTEPAWRAARRAKNRKRRALARGRVTIVKAEPAALSSASSAARTVDATQFSRDLDACVRSLRAKWLGKKMPGRPTKRSVMDEAAPEGYSPRFSKYCGTVEWRNVIFLWVNVGGTDYENLFSNEGRRLSWFAGARTKAGSKIMKRLLRSSRAGKGKKMKPEPGMAALPSAPLLFMRLPGESCVVFVFPCYCALRKCGH